MVSIFTYKEGWLGLSLQIVRAPSELTFLSLITIFCHLYRLYQLDRSTLYSVRSNYIALSIMFVDCRNTENFVRPLPSYREEKKLL